MTLILPQRGRIKVSGFLTPQTVYGPYPNGSYFRANPEGFDPYPLTFVAWGQPSASKLYHTDGVISSSVGTGTNNRQALRRANDPDPVVVNAQSRKLSGSNVQANSATDPDGDVHSNWVHMAATFASGGVSRKAFFNGVGGTAENTTRTFGTQYYIVVGHIAGPEFPFRGYLSHTAMWTSVLSDAQIADLAAGASPLDVNFADLHSYWPLVGASPLANLGNNSTSLTMIGTVPTASNILTPTL